MSTRRVDVKRIATSNPETFLDVSVSYTDGWRDGQRVRGYRLSVGVIEDHHDGFIKYLIGQGGWGFLEPATRFNQRRMSRNLWLPRPPVRSMLNRSLSHRPGPPSPDVLA